MNEDQREFLRRLVETTGPSGYEERAQALWRERVAPVAPVQIDAMGNAIATLNKDGSPRVIIEAHIDEIGFQVRYIDDDGFLWFSPIGGLDPVTLAGNPVRIMGKSGPVLGVIGRKAAHLVSDEERGKPPKLSSFWIDIGARDRAEAERLVAVGDAGGRAVGMASLQGQVITANSLDDRAGGYVIAEALRRLAAHPPQAAVIALSAVQEEIGLRGAEAGAYAINAPIGIAVDVTYTSDHPQAPKSEIGDIRVGAGPVLSRGANTNPRIFQRLVAAAGAEGISYQVDADPVGAGTDQHAMQIARGAMATGLISIPTRYLHTASEVASLEDIDACVRLLTRFVSDLTADADLIP
ncbi:MAG TPA: M20/M25/M40 family metallo-hydrolase [Chloroflexota bacterium]|nr:M20/M25/M40 family metallo-hydrolase [Chloroflexota bacterium]